jgi:streptogramin lyase
MNLTTQNDLACKGFCQTCTNGTCTTVINAPDTDSCSGTCDATGKCLTPASLSFVDSIGNPPVTNFTAIAPARMVSTFTIKNVGNQSSMPITITVTGPAFVISSHPFGCIDGQTTLDPGATCDVWVVFQSNDLGTFSATLTATAAGSGSPAALQLKVSCNSRSQATAEFLIPTLVADPEDLHLGSDSRLWFIEGHRGPGNTIVGAISLGGSITEYNLGDVRPDFIALGSDGNIWGIDSLNSQLVKITTSGVVSLVHLTGAGVSPLRLFGGMVRGPDNNFWVRESTGIAPASIVRIAPTGATTKFDTSQTGGGRFGGTRVGPDGKIWYTDSDFGASAVQNLANITTLGAITKFATPVQGEELGAIAIGGDGNMWFVKDHKFDKATLAGSITEFSTPQFLGGNDDIVYGPDENLWIATSFGHILVMSKTGATVRQIDLAGSVGGLTVGPDGNVWFGESGDLVGYCKP